MPLPNRPQRMARLFDRLWTPVTIGQSEAKVWRIEGPEETLFLKTAAQHGPNKLSDEVERLQWLARTGLLAPQMVDFFVENGVDWLLMTGVPGADLTILVERPDVLCAVLADGLRRLHAIDPATCPFDHSLPRRLEVAAINVANAWVDETDFDNAHDGWTASQVLEWLGAHQPLSHDLVVTHGDASLPNFMADGGQFSGFIDVGRLGVADRWQDLALACNSISFNCGEAYVAPFLARYGAPWDEVRYRYYTALDEMF